MTFVRSRIAVGLAAGAALAMTATSASAQPFGAWGAPPPYHHRHGVDGGDLLAGLLVVGGIAAIASAVSNSDRDRSEREDERYRADVNGYDNRPEYVAPEQRQVGSFDAAADICAGEIERGDGGAARVGAVDTVNRMGGRTNVAGHLQDGRGFACSIDDDGQVRSASIDGHAAY